MKKIAAIILVGIFINSINKVIAGPVSTNYELRNYGFGAGGTDVATSSGTNYQMYGIAGEQSATQSSSNNYKTNPGLIFTNQANLPPAPTFTNPGSAYDRLKFIVNNGSNPSDAKFAIAITDDNWGTTNYIQSDDTIGSVLGSEDWQTYAGWGSATGEYITGLQSDTTYKIKVKAETGKFTETGWGPEASTATLVPSLIFGIDSHKVSFDALISENSFTDASKQTVLTTSTNAYNGYSIYVRDTGVLADGLGNTIAEYTSPNSAPTVWTGDGFGYTTNDSNLAGGTADRFTSGGPKYAGFVTSAPGDPVADHTGPIVESPISNEQFTVSYKVKAPSNTPAGIYTNTVIYVVVPVY